MKREKDTADYDLDRFVDMFDQAMTSDDPRIKQALRQLMMMVILTDTGDHEGQKRASRGPLRQVVDDVHELTRQMHRLDNEVHNLRNRDSQRASTPNWPQVDAGYGLGGLRNPYTVDEANQTGMRHDQAWAEQVAKKINSGTI